jgi:hypothetical protein
MRLAGKPAAAIAPAPAAQPSSTVLESHMLPMVSTSKLIQATKGSSARPLSRGAAIAKRPLAAAMVRCSMSSPLS